MNTNTKYLVVDHLLNWFVFTPLIVTFWYGTYVLQDLLLFSFFETRIISITILLLFGVSVELFITFFQDEINDYVSGFDHFKFVLFSRCYNYFLSSANIAHYRALQEIYDTIFGSTDLTSSLRASVTSIVLLWSLRAGRNITAPPFSFSLDSDQEWFKAPTLYGTQRTRQYEYVLDVVLTVMVVWSLSPIHWITLGYVYDAVILPNTFALSAFVSVLLGYSIVALFSFFQHNAKEWSRFYDGNNRWISKLAFENLFIWGATAGVIMSWKGLSMTVDVLAKEYPLILFDVDLSGFAITFIPFFILCFFQLSGCLVSKGAELDGSIYEGLGVDFNREYFAIIYDKLYGSSDSRKNK